MGGTRSLFVILAALALAALLLRPLCSAAHPQGHAGDSASCCLSVAGVGAAKALDGAIDAGGKPLAVPLVFAYFAAAALFMAATLRVSAAAPPRSFYARSARILR